MSDEKTDPTSGPGSTNDPNQADNTGMPGRDKHGDVPDKSTGKTQTNPDPKTGPGTTRDPNQADRT